MFVQGAEQTVEFDIVRIDKKRHSLFGAMDKLQSVSVAALCQPTLPVGQANARERRLQRKGDAADPRPFGLGKS